MLDADRRGLNGARMTPRELRWTIANGLVLPVVFLGSIPVAYLVSPGWAPAMLDQPGRDHAVLGWLERRSRPDRIPPTPPSRPSTTTTPTTDEDAE